MLPEEDLPIRYILLVSSVEICLSCRFVILLALVSVFPLIVTILLLILLMSVVCPLTVFLSSVISLVLPETICLRLLISVVVPLIDLSTYSFVAIISVLTEISLSTILMPLPGV